MVDGISLFEFVFETVFILRIETEPHFLSEDVSVTGESSLPPEWLTGSISTKESEHFCQ